jgi:hypothetical protein
MEKVIPITKWSNYPNSLFQWILELGLDKTALIDPIIRLILLSVIPLNDANSVVKSLYQAEFWQGMTHSTKKLISLLDSCWGVGIQIV